MERRPLKSRSTFWAKSLAGTLAKVGFTPNSISILSIVFAFAVTLFGYFSTHSRWALILGALFVQLRLLCNLFDGMVAVEHNQSSPTGDLYNDVPDRFADVFILLGAGLSINHLDYYFSAVNIAWTGAVLAVITAYIRVLGKSLGTQTYYLGPMAKPHRMFLITIGFLIEFFLYGTSHFGNVLYAVLAIIVVGSFITSLRRLNLIANELTTK